MSRKRATFGSGVLFARRASSCSPLQILPGAASAMLASSPGEAFCFRLFSNIFVPISSVFVRRTIDAGIKRNEHPNVGGERCLYYDYIGANGVSSLKGPRRPYYNQSYA